MKIIRYLLLLFNVIISSSVFSQQLDIKWAQQFGGKGWDYVNGLVIDSLGNYFLGGSLRGNLENDTLHPQRANNSNAYIASCDANGHVRWQVVFGGKKFDNVGSIIRINEGILLAGIFQDTLFFEDKYTITPSYSGAYLSLIDQQGNPVLLKNIGGLAIVKQIFITSNQDDQAFIAGSFADSLQLAGQQLAKQGEQGFFIAKLQPDGNEIQPVVIKSIGNCKLGGFASKDSLICLTGSFADTLKFNDTTLVSYGGDDGFVASFSLTGQLKHVIVVTGMGNDQINSVVFSHSGDLAILGKFDNSMLIGNEILQSNGGKDVFIAALDSLFNIKWVKNIGGLGNDNSYTISCNNDNEYFITGNFIHYIEMPDQNNNTVTLDASNAFGNAFMAKLSSNGELLACYNLPATSEDYCKSLITSSDGMITAVGNFYGTIHIPNFDGDTIELVSVGERDIFLIRFEDLCKGVTVDAGIDTSLCPESSIYLYPNDWFPYFRWLPDGLPNQGINVTQPGTYHLLITDQHGCIASDSLHVNLAEPPIVSAGNDTTLSAGENLILMHAATTNAISTEWSSNGTGYFSNPEQLGCFYIPSYSDISVGSVVLTLTGVNQCGNTSDHLILTIRQDQDGITVYPNPTQGLVTLVCTQGVSIQRASITTQAGFMIEPNITVNGTYMQYNLFAYPSGTYLFHLVTGSQTITKIINKL